MKCSNCGKEVESGSAFCPACGQKFEYEEEVKPEVVEETAPKAKEHSREKGSLAIIGLTFSALGAFISLIVGALILALNTGNRGFGYTGASLITVLTVAGLGLNLYVVTDKSKKMLDKILSGSGIALSAFTLFFEFLAICVSLGKFL